MNNFHWKVYVLKHVSSVNVHYALKCEIFPVNNTEFEATHNFSNMCK